MMKRLLVVALVGVFSASAYAGDFYINAGKDWFADPDGNTITAPIRSLGLTGSLATSVYYNATFVGGNLSTASIFDSNTVSQLNALGYPIMPGDATTHSYTALAGNTVSFHNPAAPGEVDIDNLNMVNGASLDKEGFSASPLSFIQQWGMEFAYSLDGTLNAGNPGQPVQYNAKYIDLFYTGFAGVPGIGVPQELIRLKVEGSQLDNANLEIKGKATFDFAGTGDSTLAMTAAQQTFVRQFFNDIGTGQNFYDLWLAGAAINFSFNTNVVPPVPTRDQLVQFTYVDPVDGLTKNSYIRQANLDSHIKFNVVPGNIPSNIPTPTPLVLLGLGLFGFAVSRNIRKV
jgi:hypothetical protein